AKIKAIYDYLNSLSLKDRIHEVGLRSDRADVIIRASEIFLTIMKVGGLKNITAPRVGLVDGIIQTLIDKNFKKQSLNQLQIPKKALFLSEQLPRWRNW